MKLRDCDNDPGQRRSGRPSGSNPLGQATRLAVAEDGVLEGLQRLGNRLWLQITITGCRRTANMEWDPLPAVGGVEVVLLASIGAKIRRLGDLPGNGGLGDEPSSRLEGFWASGLCWASACSWAGSCEDGSASTSSGSRMNSERATARKGANDGSADRADGSRAAGQGRGVCGLRHCDVGDYGPVQ